MKHKYWIYPRVGYYRHGFKKDDVLMSDCHKIEREFYEFRLIAVPIEHKAYEAICLTIKEKHHQAPSYFIIINSR